MKKLSLKKMMSLISISTILLLGHNAAALFDPSQGPKPHTICFEDSLRDAGLQILLTDIKAPTPQRIVRADVYERDSRESEQIASRSTEQVNQEDSVVYVGHDFSLKIENEVRLSETLRTGELEMVLQNGQRILKILKCDGIMHVMGAI